MVQRIVQRSLAPLILTLKLDSKTFNSFDWLRQQHFPREKNFLPAHITLFHALPGEQQLSIQQTLRDISSQTAIFSLSFPKLRFLGKGVAIEVDSPSLIQLRQQLAKIWYPWLSRQDRQGYRPHVTIQNKVTAEEARQLFDRMDSQWQLIEGEGEGLLLWYYRGGPWELAEAFAFQAASP